MSKSTVNNKTKREKDTVNPNPDLKRVPYEYIKSYGVNLNELNEGYAFYLAFDDTEIMNKIKELEFKKEMFIRCNKERVERIKKESEEYYNDFQKIKVLETKINEYNNNLKESNLLEAPAVLRVQARLMDLVKKRQEKLNDDDIKHWNVQKIDFTTVKRICEEENAPIRASIQKIDSTVLKDNFKGCNRYIKK